MGGISLEEAKTDRFGLRMDRRWMLIDAEEVAITQRSIPELCLFECEYLNDKLVVTHKDDKGFKVIIEIGAYLDTKRFEVQVFEDRCEAYEVSAEISRVFSDMLSKEVKLVYMPETAERQVDEAFADKGVFTSFSDGFPILMIGEESLNDLNEKLEKPVSMLRFRPNLVFSGGYPFVEDDLKVFHINGLKMQVVKPCARCVVTTVDMATAKKGKEPLKTLASYRMKGNKIFFGQNILLEDKETIIRVGDELVLKN